MDGERFGHYRVVECVGSGAMGVVYRAHDERLDREVAIKVLAGGTLDETARAQLRKEARAISRAVHPSVATVHDLATDGDRDFLVMEFVEGPTLADRIAQGPLPEPEVVALGCQLASGLSAAHAAGVVHRDIKPSNLKITPDGRLKILDFGIAQLRPTSIETTRTGTSPGRPAGTLPYMSPEQIRGVRPDPRSDVYAAGAVLYELATGVRPFPERYELELIDAVLRRPVAPPRTIRPDLSPALEVCLLKALEKDPGARFQSAADLESALRLTAAMDLAGGATPRTTAAASSRRTKWAWAALALAIVITSGVTRQWLASRRESAEPAGAPPAAAPPAAAAPAPSAGTPTTPSTRVRLAVLPPRNLTNRPPLEAWLPIVQTLLTGELTGVQDLGVIDPLSLNTRLGEGSTAENNGSAAKALRELGVDLVLETRIVRAGAALQLQANVVDARSAEVRFTARSDLAGEADLPRAVHAASQSVVSYLQLRVFKLADTHDMRPWVTLRDRNVEAVKAFVQANHYIFKFQFAEVEGLLRRAVELDPAFVAPRLWLTQQLFDKGDVAGAQAQYRELKRLESVASPFDQAMIGFAGAMLADDDARQIRYLAIALDYSPGNNILLVNMAHARTRLGDCKGALQDLQPAVDMVWEFPLVYPMWAVCAIRLGRFDDARRVLDVGAGLSVVDSSVYGLLAGLEAAFGTKGTAEQFEARYVARLEELHRPRADPMLAKVYDLLASHCASRGDADRAAVLRGMRDRASGLHNSRGFP